MMEILEEPMREINMATIDCDKQTVQVMAIIGIVVLGTVAMIFDGEMGETIAVAVAAALGVVVGRLFAVKDKGEVKE